MLAIYLHLLIFIIATTLQNSSSIFIGDDTCAVFWAFNAADILISHLCPLTTSPPSDLPSPKLHHTEQPVPVHVFLLTLNVVCEMRARAHTPLFSSTTPLPSHHRIGSCPLAAVSFTRPFSFECLWIIVSLKCMHCDTLEKVNQAKTFIN